MSFFFATISSMAALLLTGQAAPELPPAPAELPKQVFVLGDATFEPGDSITVTDVRGQSPLLSAGQWYEVAGRYTLASRDAATLGVFVTDGEVASGTTQQIKKGTGTYRVRFFVKMGGAPHVSFYPASPGGDSFGGIYFAREKQPKKQ